MRVALHELRLASEVAVHAVRSPRPAVLVTVGVRLARLLADATSLVGVVHGFGSFQQKSHAPGMLSWHPRQCPTRRPHRSHVNVWCGSHWQSAACAHGRPETPLSGTPSIAVMAFTAWAPGCRLDTGRAVRVHAVPACDGASVPASRRHPGPQAVKAITAIEGVPLKGVVWMPVRWPRR